MKKYILYARVNGSSQMYGSSISSQKDVLRKFARLNGLNITEEIVEIGSAALSKKRKPFRKLIKKLRSGQANGVLCTDIDRLTRNVAGSSLLINLIEKKGIEIITLNFSFKNDRYSKFFMGLGVTKENKNV